MRPELFVLGQIRLHDPQPHRRIVTGVVTRQPERAECGERNEYGRSCDHRQPAAGPVRQQRWGRRESYGQDGEAVKANDRGGLRKHMIAAEGHPEVVPGEARQDDGTQPFREPEAGGQRQDPPAVVCPDQSRSCETDPGKDSEHGRKPHHAERERPRELIGFHEEGGAKPPQAREKVTEPEPPARLGRLPWSAER